ncbi:GNAT family N-acetyltransferase [Mucilaginibacter conchicola]|uniref:GNAT family N-acetyltransferase n=1 Tax=Mucilaginibacter conchicola TaxID=2303333 RepID=A0A372NR56_9SPHI|nr:GNAT family N-acetyltransferase [Mucilaginibacter conchicola]RFZ90743.1 GNAT family N-acetyltransferase [Mucilaginibacter conchicola]
MQLRYIIKPFNELTTTELYALLRLRAEVFVVEQNCVYLDLDGKDQQSYHLLYYADDELAAYTRLVPAGVSFDEISIGRVITSPRHRGIGLGKQLIDASIEGCYKKFGRQPIRIGAQLYLLKFYQSFGFVEQSEVYDEDGIPHIEMVKAY